MKPGPPAVEARSPNPWTAREFPPPSWIIIKSAPHGKYTVLEPSHILLHVHTLPTHEICIITHFSQLRKLKLCQFMSYDKSDKANK